MSGAKEMEEEKGKRAGWGGFGADGLTALVGDWDGVGVVEISGQRRVGKSVSLFSLEISHHPEGTAS